MSPVVVDWLTLLASVIGLIYLLRGWSKIASATLRHTLAVLVFLVLFNSLSNSLQWSGITSAFDTFEDYIQLLIPLMYGLAVYDMLRRRTEQDLQEAAGQLRQERDLVQSIAQTSPAGIMLLDPHGNITYVNRRAEQVLGWSSAHLLGSKCTPLEWGIIGPDGSLVTQEQLPYLQVARTRQPLYDMRCSIQRPDHQQVHLTVNAAPLFASSDELQGVVMTFEDITQRLHAELALRESERNYRQIFNASSDAILIHDPQTGEILDANQTALDLFGYSYGEILRLSIAHLTTNPAQDSQQVAGQWLQDTLHSGPQRMEWLALNRHGESFWVEVALSAVELNGQPRLQAAIRDISQRKQIEQALFDEKERAQVTLHSIGDAVITTDAQARVEYLNPIAQTMTGWTMEEARGRALAEVFHLIDEETRQPAPDPVARCLQEGKIIGMTGHAVLVSRNDKEFNVDDTAAPIRSADGQIHGVVLVFHDVTEARRLERQMAHDAAHDTLTGLVNRREFEVRIERALVSAKERGANHVLCYMDLDQFKIINDTAGHAAGDEVLKQVANLLSGLFRQRDTLARLGGDEFGLLLENCPLERGVTIATEIISQIQRMPFEWQGRIYQLGTSIGVVPIDAQTESLAQALSQADVACYTAKDLGRGRVHVYQWKESESAQRHSEILRAARLRDALEWEQFQLYCQPIVPLQPGESLPRYEILLRLLDEDGQLLLPATFIPSAERYGMMSIIDRWVIQAAFRRYAIHFSGAAGPQISINLSGNSLNDESLLDFVYTQLREHSVPPDRICFEITESAAIHNLTRAQHFASEVNKMGGRIALDDFGSGFSSFRYLKNMPVSYLKIEGSFVRDMLESASDRVMVAAINQVGHTLGIQTVAEHVSDPAIIAELRQIGVDFAQGFAIGRPQPLAEAWTTASKSPWELPRGPNPNS